MKKYGFFFILLILIQVTAVFEMALSFSMGPTVVERLGILPARYGYTNLGYVFLGLLSPLLGRSADRAGYKKTFAIICLLMTTGSLIVWLTGDALVYTLARALMGLSYFSIMALVPSLIVLVAPHHRIGTFSGIFKLAFASGIFIAPLAGALLLERIGYGGIYLSIAMVSLVLFLLILLSSPPEKGSPKQSTKVKKTPPAGGLGLLLGAALASPVPIAMISSYLGIHLSGRGLSQNEISLVYTVMGTGSLAAGVFIIFFSDRAGKFPSALGGAFVVSGAVTALHFAGASNPGAGLAAAAFLFYFGFDTFTGLFFSTVGLCFPENRNHVLTLMTAGSALGMFLATLASPRLFSLGFNYNVLAALGGSLMTGIFYFAGYRKNRRKS